MKIERIDNNGQVTLKLFGCLDTTAAQEFGQALAGAEAATELVIDFTGLEFIASSGIRHLVSANKKASSAGRSIVLTGMNEVVSDVFEVTGLTEVFTVR